MAGGFELFFRDRLSLQLGEIGIPNQYPELRLNINDTARFFGRAYIGWMRVSDEITTPYGEELYERCAHRDRDTTLLMDRTGDRSGRPAPIEGHVYAVVHSPTWSSFWRRLEDEIGLRIDDGYLIHTDEFIATYGLPAGSEPILDAELTSPQG